MKNRNNFFRLMITLFATLSFFGIVSTSFSQETRTFKDPRDGKVYKTVKIGSQTWFAENLTYKPSSGNYWAYDDNQSNVSKYGYLYDWETAKTVCPAGWHLPTDDEWKTLINYLGGEIVAGGKMKATTDWRYDAAGNATNESGFNALPAGIRSDGAFKILTLGARFWSSTPADSTSAWSRILGYGYGRVIWFGQYRTDGYSVRCVKN